MLHRLSFYPTVIATLLCASSAMAGDPTAAVSDVTETIMGVGGSAGGKGTFAGGADISFPITHSIGA